MLLLTEYLSLSGFAHNDCYFLARRFDVERYESKSTSEYWMVSVQSAENSQTNWDLAFGTKEKLTGLWQSETRIVYVTSASGKVWHMRQTANDTDFVMDKTVSFKLDVKLQGIWGLNDQCVFAWGETKTGSRSVFYWDGISWAAIGSPGFSIHCMHGVSPDCLYAGGYGKIAKWNGAEWLQYILTEDKIINNIHVVSAEEQYAVTHGSVWQGDSSGWKIIAEGPKGEDGRPELLSAVTNWMGTLWIGSSTTGIYRLNATGKLDLVNTDIRPTAFDSRKKLVMICTDNTIAELTEDSQFTVTDPYQLENMLELREFQDFS